MTRIVKKRYPIIPLRNMTVIPGMIVHFDVNRDSSKNAVETAMMRDQKIFLVAQRKAEQDAPMQQDLYEVGCVANIKQVIKLPNGVVRVLVEGDYRARLLMLFEDNTADTKQWPLINLSTDEELSAMVAELRDRMTAYVELNPKIAPSLQKQFMEAESVEAILDSIAINVPMEFPERQAYLESDNIYERFTLLTVFFARESEVLRIRKKLQTQVQDRVQKNQKEYVLREEMKCIREELGESPESDIDTYRKKLRKLKASAEVKEKISKEIDRLGQAGSYTSESSVLRGYIETLLEYPWEIKSVDYNDVSHAGAILNEDHYGLDDVKERILEFLAVRNLVALNRNPAEDNIAPIICLVGPPGTGKTSVAKSIARALNKKYVRICLGGVRDEAEIRGHRKTYVGAMPGRIATGMKNAGVKNPLMLLDEIDKMSSDYKGDPASAMLEVLDGEQNSRFVDHYFEVPIDLSQVLFIATANSVTNIPKPLLDRMEVIEVLSYTENEKKHIAVEHLIPKQIRRHGLVDSELVIQEKALEKLIRGYTKEAGVRNLERQIAKLCRKAAVAVNEKNKKSLVVTTANLQKLMGKEKFFIDPAPTQDEIGIVRGLAWTSVGGDTLEIEVNVMPGKGEVLLTGQLGDVMKESAQAGLSYIRSISEGTGLKPNFFKEHDFHIHIPDGAVPKDGPSAGITMATALYSAIFGKPVRADVCMTGEVTLRGRVLPIGGLKEKILAAKVAGLRTVLVPEKNRPDIEEIAGEIKRGLTILYVNSMEDVLKEALR